MKEGTNLFARFARPSLPLPTAQFLPIMLEATPPPRHCTRRSRPLPGCGMSPPSLPPSYLIFIVSFQSRTLPSPSLSPSLPSPPSLPLHITSWFTHRLAVAPGCNFGVTSPRTHSRALTVPSLSATIRPTATVDAGLHYGAWPLSSHLGCRKSASEVAQLQSRPSTKICIQSDR